MTIVLLEPPLIYRYSTRAELLRRVRELETELESTSPREAVQTKTMSILSQERPEGTEAEGTETESVQKEANFISEHNDPTSAGSPIEHEATVDELATGAFNDVPEVNIGYFGNTKLSTKVDISAHKGLRIFIGSSSNFAIFRHFSGIFALTTQIYISVQSQSQDRTRTYRVSATIPSSPSPLVLVAQDPRNQLQGAELYALPQEQELRFLINHFFVTVGAVLPFVSKSAVLAEYSRVCRESFKHMSRTFRALLNIICAHASSSLHEWDSELFYQRSLALLDNRVLSSANMELSRSSVKC